MLVRSAERAPYSAPQTASASADMSVLMKVVSICRNRSGLAWASCSCRKRVGSILLGAVVAFFSWSPVRGMNVSVGSADERPPTGTSGRVDLESQQRSRRTAFAIAGLGGNNAHVSAGHLAVKAEP